MPANNAKTCREVWMEMESATKTGQVRNFTRTIDMADFTVVTELFPQEALHVYSHWNLEEPVSEEHRKKYFSAHRGGLQRRHEGQDCKRGGLSDEIPKIKESCHYHSAQPQRRSLLRRGCKVYA